MRSGDMFKASKLSIFSIDIRNNSLQQSNEPHRLIWFMNLIEIISKKFK
jgi:hypothetical protein